MIQPSQHYDDESPDVLAVDAELNALAARRSTSNDPAMHLLREFAQEVDVRAAAMGRGGRTDPPWSMAPLPIRPASSPVPHVRRASGRRRTARRVLLSAPIAAAFVLLIGLLPVNASPSSPLHPLHALIFQDDGPTPEQQIRADLAGAEQELNGAGECGSTVHTDALDHARRHLDDARGELSKVDDETVRSRLQTDMSSLERRADDLARCAADEQGGQGGQGGSGDQGQDQGHNRDEHTATPSPSPDNEGDQGGAEPTKSGDPRQSAQ
jgi:hypothetical protein